MIPTLLYGVSYDLKKGRCSGIPWCCIAFYILLWMPLRRFQRLRKAYTRWAHKDQVWTGEYVPCPLCRLLKHQIQIKQCSPACSHDP